MYFACTRDGFVVGHLDKEKRAWVCVVVDAGSKVGEEVDWLESPLE